MKRRAKLDRTGQVWQDCKHPTNIWVVISSAPEFSGSDFWKHVMLHLIRGRLEHYHCESRRFPWDHAASQMQRIC